MDYVVGSRTGNANFSSSNLKDWAFESSFGEGQGAHGGVWECPDLFELPVDGTNEKKWVLLCNLNPGGPFGGSATQYFVGTFNGKEFANESPSNQMDGLGKRPLRRCNLE